MMLLCATADRHAAFEASHSQEQGMPWAYEDFYRSRHSVA